MEKKDEELILSLMKEVPELRSLYSEHQTLKKQLETLNHKHFLTSEEEVEKKRIQKLKLAGKDRMMELVTSIRAGSAKQEAATR